METMVSQAEFARNNGWARSYVTQLKHDGRLVMEKKGRRDYVCVESSLELIAKTADSNRDDVKKRWQSERDQPNAAAAEQANAEEKSDQAVMSYQVARAMKEGYAARKAKLEYEREVGTLVALDDVNRAFSAQWTQLRISMDHLRDQISAELSAESDQDLIHAMLGEHFERLQSELCQKLESKLGVKP